MEYKVYWKRWLLLAILCFGEFTRNYLLRSISVANNFAADYFRVDPSAIDILSVIDNLVASPALLLLGILGSYLGLRNIMLLQVFFAFAGTTLTTVGFLSRELYWVVLVGRVLPEAILSILPIILAANWFPDRELATVLGIQLFFNALGGIVSGIVLPYMLRNLRLPEQHVNSTQSTVISNIYDDERIKFTIAYGATAVIAFVLLLLTLIYCKDHPPTPPSAAQSNICNITEVTPGTNVIRDAVLSRLRDIKFLLTDSQFLLILLAVGIKAPVFVYTVLVPSFLAKESINVTTTGWLIFVTYAFSGIAAIIGGRLLDTFKYFKLTVIIICHTAIIICCISIYFRLKFLNMTLLFIAIPLVQAFSYVASTSLSDLMVEITYPIDKTVTSSLFFSAFNIAGFLCVNFCRWVEEISDENWAVFLLIPLNCLSMIPILLIKPKYKRTDMDREALLEETENLVQKFN